MDKEIQFILYNMPESDGKVQALIKDDTIWLTQKAMAELFGCSSDNISLHLKNIFASNELDKDAVTEKISATAADGKKYQTQFYSLDAIISVGYRVNSLKATRFRQWATKNSFATIMQDTAVLWAEYPCSGLTHIFGCY